MRRIVTTLAAALLALSMMVGPGVADEHQEGPPPEHGHLFVQRPVIEFLADGPQGPGVYATGFRKCVDLPVVPLTAHHSSLHTGSAGEALVEHAGHAVVPAAPLTPWESCADLEAALPIFLG
jgi:hypothetical protein